MKKLFISMAVFCALNANAQNYNITFTGIGSSSTVASIKVENLTTGLTRDLSGDDVLHLTGIVGIPTIGDRQSSEIKIYPNPVTDNSLLEFYPPAAGDAIISIFEITGKVIAQIQSYLENSKQEFQISGLKSGYFLVNVRGKSYQLSGKIMSKSTTNRNPVIERFRSDQAMDEKEPDNELKGTQGRVVDMEYAIGQRLKYTGKSGNYTTILTDIPTQTKLISFNFMPCTDHDNNNYPVVEIGSQVWMAENLKTTTYSNGDIIGTTTPPALDITNETNPKYQWAYDADENNVPVYGRLYTWHAATDIRSVCPDGWYVPRDADITLLTTFLEGETVAAGKLKETGITHWTTPNTGATDDAGFTALPGGMREINGTFKYIGMSFYLYSSSAYNTLNAWYRGIYYSKADIIRGYAGKRYGLSIRCVKVNFPIVETTPVTTVTTTSATVGGEVTSDGGITVTDRGVFFSHLPNPVASGIKIQSGSGEGTFEINVSGLTPDKIYYVIAYAINSIGTTYGEELSLKTEPLTLPVLITKPATSITQAKAISGGDIYYDGGVAVTSRGVCWSKAENPTIADDHTSDGSDIGSFSSYIKGLSHSTKYYVRAYAVNSVGIAYGDPISFTTLSGGPIVFNSALTYGTVTDIEGNVYKTIQVGTRAIMAENLRTTKYNDNKPISGITDNTIWKNLTTPGYCWYDNDSLTYKSTYGALYNWFAVNTGKLCPTGWHVPTDPEYMQLVNDMGGLIVAGGKIKEAGLTHWISPNTGATNETGFTGLPGGRRYFYDGTFITIGQLGYFWSSTENEGVYGGVGIMHYNSAELEGDAYSKPNGMSVRCMKD